MQNRIGYYYNLTKQKILRLFTLAGTIYSFNLSHNTAVGPNKVDTKFFKQLLNESLKYLLSD